MDPLTPLVWRPFVLSRVALLVSAVWAAFLGVYFVIGRLLPCSTDCFSDSTGDEVLRITAGFSLVILGVGLLSAAFTYVRVSDRDLTVRNLFWRSTTVPLHEISGAEPGYAGLLVRLADGHELPCVAVQTSNWRMWFARPGRGGSIADEIVRRAELVRTRDNEEASQPSSTGPEDPGCAGPRRA